MVTNLSLAIGIEKDYAETKEEISRLSDRIELYKECTQNMDKGHKIAINHQISVWQKEIENKKMYQKRVESMRGIAWN